MHLVFPEKFLWGASLSAYQCEGGNYNCDWHDWEKISKLEKAGKASEYYSRYDSDHHLAASLNLNALRVSVEWSRIFPEEGVVDQEQLQHYINLISSLIQFRLTPLVTLHHFTNPLWVMKRGGWLNPDTVGHFLKFVRLITEALKKQVKYWLVLNEPLVYVYNGYISGIWPPGEKSVSGAYKALKNIFAAYETAYDEIKAVYRGEIISPCISLSKHIRDFYPCPGSFFTSLPPVWLRNREFNYLPLRRLLQKNKLDFIGLNYYCREYVSFGGRFGRTCQCPRHKERQNAMGWYIEPGSLFKILMKLKKMRLPVIITENGTAERQEYLYHQYLHDHLLSAALACKAGLDLKGYFWWSLTDNFEWERGFDPRFGLLEVDYRTMRRNKRPFALYYAKICRDNRIEK